MTRPHAVAGVVFLLLSAFLGRESTRLAYYTPLGPGAGFFPVWLCVALALLALIVLAAALRGRLVVGEARFLPAPAALGRVVAIVAGLAIVAATLPVLGFRITMAAFCVGAMLALGAREPVPIVVVALLGSVGCKALFTDALGLALPAGVLGW